MQTKAPKGGVAKGPGRPPKISDAELVTLALAQVFIGLAEWVAYQNGSVVPSATLMVRARNVRGIQR